MTRTTLTVPPCAVSGKHCRKDGPSLFQRRVPGFAEGGW